MRRHRLPVVAPTLSLYTVHSRRGCTVGQHRSRLGSGLSRASLVCIGSMPMPVLWAGVYFAPGRQYMATSFVDFVKTRKEQEEITRPNGAPTLYAHPTDSAVQRMLARGGLQGSVEAVINAYLRVAMGAFLHDTVQVSPR